MNTNTWNRIRYNFYAPFYDWIGRLFNAPRRRAIELLALQPGECVLLLGAGTGSDLEFLPEYVQISAIDISPAMVKQIKRRAKRLNRKVEVHVMDGQKLDFPDDTFDAITLHLVLAVIPDPYACISEVERVLKPGGRLTIFDKFLPLEADVSLSRKIGNVLAGFLFSEINRRLQPIIATTSLDTVHEEPARFEKLGYQITLLKKPANDGHGVNNV